ncbi:tetratricopeptide repeat protein [Branchiibius hedensis]|uniref:tetratricopeptide repeat protein n=1 Tax=Branchiibius hedensis TaxID=672460 RepID=UPI001FEBB990|nr:tetratricopeptide repeat protein [Branchiibius hedensis]
MVLALIKGQPLPLYMGPQPADAVRGVFDQVLQAAQQAGVTGTVPVEGAPPAAQEPESDEDPLLAQAYDAIEAGDYDAAIAAYDQLLATNPEDEGARLGRGQVLLLQRTADLDATTVREAAAQNPTDVAAQTQVADLDLLGGHVEDAFARLIDLVRATSGDDRSAAREHLIGLFDIIGSTDERVKKARTALMSALY